MRKNRGSVRVVGASMMVALVVAGAGACSSDKKKDDAAPAAASAAATSKGPEAFSAAGYRGLKPGITKDAALAGGTLETAPVSLLDGCTDFSYKGGPAPDKVRMDAEAATEAKFKDLNGKADAAAAKQPGAVPTLPPNASAADSANIAAQAAGSAQNSAADAKLMADAAQSSVDMLTARETRNKAFATSGRVSFATSGLRELVAPADARTAEGIGVGSTADAVQAAYGSKGLVKDKYGSFTLPVEGQPGWTYEFTVTDAKVTGLTLANRTLKCTA
ncbi:hypothetical protein ACIBCA_28765 [Kitasatospora sp. NPDC051170]|uniref:hypothetical protein n=1 Tax=Kitasatospora sp. NPDC051170 TaxID=3364056 RepID=UPI0037AF6B1C